MKKVFIVENHPDLLDTLTLQMEEMVFAVTLATNGIEAVEKVIEEKPHLILMDIMLPGIDGLEATRRIRSNPEAKEIPILVATQITAKGVH